MKKITVQIHDNVYAALTEIQHTLMKSNLRRYSQGEAIEHVFIQQGLVKKAPSKVSKK